MAEELVCNNARGAVAASPVPGGPSREKSSMLTQNRAV